MKRFIYLFFALSLEVQALDWSEGRLIPRGGLSNPYELSEAELLKFRRAGLLHALNYPVDVSGSLPPYNPIENVLRSDSGHPLREILQRIFRGLANLNSMDDVQAMLGLHRYPQQEGEGVTWVPFEDPSGVPMDRMGFSSPVVDGVKRFTFSCAACHSGNLFGQKIIGLSNRFPRANEFFVLGKQAVDRVGPHTFDLLSGATSEEKKVYKEFRENLMAVEAQKPQALGLDTSLAQVSLSLSKRSEDEWATKNPKLERSPRESILKNVRADSKPMVWWNVKYKNRWLSDGSVVSGNPIYTNILWNEIGRGSDLRKIQDWLQQNPDIVEQLTTAVFTSEAPRYEAFFGEQAIDLEKAKRGELHYKAHCLKCHGTYVKAWSVLSESASLKEKIQTLEVIYHEDTPVKDVGTDSQRYMAMKELEERLNPLRFSQDAGIVIRSEEGYVPPPLVGIWARWPYFHNNSIPNLCALLTPSKKRPEGFWMGEALDPSKDFDQDCVGYPLGSKAPKEWSEDPSKYYDAKKSGLSAAGHDEGIFIKNGIELLSSEDKKELIEFLKTL